MRVGAVFSSLVARSARIFRISNFFQKQGRGVRGHKQGKNLPNGIAPTQDHETSLVCLFWGGQMTTTMIMHATAMGYGVDVMSFHYRSGALTLNFF